MFVFKVEFNKVFDSISWSFLKNMMMLMEFCDKWISWIMACVSYAKISVPVNGNLVPVNGNPTDEFKNERGVPQGCPLSFLFIIATECLRVVVFEAVEKCLYKGVNLSNNSPNLSIFQHADDAIFLGEWSKENALKLLCILKCFHTASGFKVNHSKSNCGDGSLPFSYLGVPVGAKISRKSS